MDRKYYSLFLICLIAAIGLNFSDLSFEIRGILARASDGWDRSAYILASVFFHLALLLGPMKLCSTVRHRALWSIALVLVFVYSLVQTLAGQQTAITSNQQQAQIQQQALDLKRSAASSALASASVKQSHGYASRSDSSIAQAALLSDDLLAISSKVKVSNRDAYALPLAVVNFFAGFFGAKMSPDTAVLTVHAMMSIGFILLSSLFSISSVYCYEKARQNCPRHVPVVSVSRVGDVRTIKPAQITGQKKVTLSDSEIRLALQDHVRAHDRDGTKNKLKSDRDTVLFAIKSKHGVGVKAVRADKFKPDLQALLDHRAIKYNKKIHAVTA